MEDLYFSLNETMPVLLEMLFGAFLHKAGLLSDRFTDDLNKFVFKIALPMQLFHELAVQDFASAWDGRYVLFCFLATLLSIAIVSLLSSLIVKTKAERGEFIQAAYRSSAALLGVAFLQNMYGEGNTGMGPLMILGAVPLYNIFAVIVLMVTAEHSADDAAGRKKDSSLARKTFIGVITNPILDSILIGLIWSLLRIPTPKILFTSINNIGKTASPLGLIAMGSACQRAVPSRTYRGSDQTCRSRSSVSAAGRSHGLSKAAARFYYDHAWFSHHSHMLYHGPQYEPQG